MAWLRDDEMLRVKAERVQREYSEALLRRQQSQVQRGYSEALLRRAISDVLDEAMQTSGTFSASEVAGFAMSEAMRWVDRHSKKHREETEG